jgi:hypothetical protein
LHLAQEQVLYPRFVIEGLVGLSLEAVSPKG